MRGRFTLLVILISAAWASGAGVVTFTLRLHEASNGTVTINNQFAIYATVSQGDNSGLFAYSLDLTGTSDIGGPTLLTLVNRTPNGTWDADQADPNFDPGADYATKFGGFGAARSASGASGVVRGMMDLAKGNDLVRVYGVGQQAHRMDEFRPSPDMSTGVPVAYGAYLPAPSTDGGGTAYGNPFNPAGFTPLPAGTVRILTGTWSGIEPSIEALSINTGACVWKLNTSSDEVEAAVILLQIRDFLAGEGSPTPLATALEEPIGSSSDSTCAVPEPGIDLAAGFGCLLIGSRRRRRLRAA